MISWSGVVARIRGWRAGRQDNARSFSTSGPIDALVRGIFGTAWDDASPVDRESALSCHAVARGRDEICAIATLPLVNFRGSELLPNAFLDQPDPDVPRVVMFAQTIEDLICDGISWWMKTGLDYRNFPTSARRVVNVSLTPPAGETRTPAPLPGGLDPRGASVWVDGREVPAALMIRFDSPQRPLLTTGARSIRRGLLLDRLASLYADNPRPLEQFTDTDDQTVAKYSDDEVSAFLASYRQARKRGSAAWIPGAVKRMDVNAPSPAELQLVQLQQQVALELAVFMGLDPEDVGVNTTSRTYFNGTDRDRNKINRTLGPYMSAITDRLSMGDVTPRGQRVRFDLTDYLKPDPATQAAYWQALKSMGVVDAQWIAEQAGVPAVVVGRVVAPQPAVAPALGQNARILPAQLGPALTAQRQLAAAFADPAPSGWQFSVADFGAAAPAPKVDVPSRTITGLAVPYGAVARKYGVGFRFRPGSLEYDAANLNRLRVKDGHVGYVGVHTKVDDTKAGPVVSLKILDGPEGSPTKMQRDQLLMDAAGGLADGLSIGVDFSLLPEDGDVEWSEQDQVFDVLRATWNETSITPDPAFTGARVTSVAASRFGGFPMECQHCHRPHPAGMSCAVAAQLYPAAQPATAGAAAVPAGFAYAAPPPPPAPPAGYPAGHPQAAPWTNAAAGVPSVGIYPAPQQFAAPLPPGPQAAAALPAGPASADALTAALTNHVQALLNKGTVAGAPPSGQEFAQPVNPAALPVPGQAAPGQTWGVQVREPEPYRIAFDRKGFAQLGRGSHDFSSDMIAALRDGDQAAHDRALAFVQKHMQAQFNVATTDVNEANPTRQRPDLYVDQREFRYPLWDAVNKGSLTDITPFTFPKFNSASGLVGAHTEGSEPSTGSFTTAGQTVTPTAYSSLATINREVWDQGGNPQVSSLIWNQMVRGVGEALEALVVTTLNAGSFTALNTFTAGNADRQIAGNTLGNELEAGIAALQFVRGGYRFTDGFLQADAYLTLAATLADDGRPRYPMQGPANVNGQATTKFGELDIAGQPFYPEWALAASGQTAATKSYLLDRTAVSGWASAPQRITMDQTAVATVGLGVWGYQACAISDTNGVRTISWDPVA